MKRPSTVGAHVVPARFGELARALSALSGDDLDQLNTGIGRWMRWPLGHLLTAVVLPLGGSVFVCLYNLEPAGVSLIRRFNNTARVMALAVAPDLRRNGIARTLLEDAAVRAAARDIRWLWMTIPSVNIAATRCALRCGFRRYRPQFLRCEIKPLIQAPAYDVMLYEVHDQQAEQAIAQWLEVEVDAGDAWIKDLLMG
ncbi:MAG: GNAT family N-acetyltransferase, partial [Anaerolineae bacterium]|nr:GNAT family N-acetyltransferase [Thermoflexales bacterium]MDW8408841.1 GNAT family N-acetyltransferase [Anaerolineae bacterium]